jgi:hypothetical protein
MAFFHSAPAPTSAEAHAFDQGCPRRAIGVSLNGMNKPLRLLKHESVPAP